MIFFIFGEDSFRANRKLQEIRHYYKERFKNLNLFQIDFEEDKKENPLENLKSITETSPLFQEKKFVIVKNANQAPSFLKDKILLWLKEKNVAQKSTTILLFYEPRGIKKTDKLIKFLLENSFKKQEFKKLSRYNLLFFLKKEVEKQGGRISQENLNYLINFLGDNLWNLENEVKKLISYKGGSEISKEDIERVCTLDFSPGIFKITDSILEGKKNMALKLFEKAIKNGESEISILGAIIFNFRALIKIKSLTESKISYWEMSKKSKLHPFVIRKLYPIVKKNSMDKLKKTFNLLAWIEKKIKRGKIPPTFAIELLIVKI